MVKLYNSDPLHFCANYKVSLRDCIYSFWIIWLQLKESVPSYPKRTATIIQLNFIVLAPSTENPNSKLQACCNTKYQNWFIEGQQSLNIKKQGIFLFFSFFSFAIFPYQAETPETLEADSDFTGTKRTSKLFDL